MDGFSIIVCNPPGGSPDTTILSVAACCGALGVLNCTGAAADIVREALGCIRQSNQPLFAVRLSVDSLHLLPVLKGMSVLIDISSVDQVSHVLEAGCQGLIVRGVALAAQLVSLIDIPVWVTGIGPESFAACQSAGAAGVVIEHASLLDPLHSLPLIVGSWKQAAGNASGVAAASVMQQFQQLMGQFLETQAAVMTAYLKSGAMPLDPLPVPVASVPLPVASSVERTEQPAILPRARDYSSELCQVASERTGYPPDMLDPDAAIESDLGIDSIKRAEILSAFQKLCSAAEQEKVQAIMDRLAAARTLREIAEHLAVVLPGPAEGKPRPSIAAAPVPRFVLTTTAKPRRLSKPQYYPGRISIVTDDETGIAAGLADQLNGAGERALLLRHNPDAMFDTGDLFTTDLTDAAAIESAVGMIRQEYGPIGAVIHLLPLRSGSGLPPNSTLAHWHELVQLDVRTLYALARATESDLKRTGRAGGALFAVATGRGGDFGLHPDRSTSPTHFGAADFTKALALEFSGVLCKIIDLDPTDPVVILQKKVSEELTAPDETLQIGLPGDRRLTIVPQFEPLSSPGARTVQHDWVILVTGGARGIAAEIARHLAGHCQPTLLLAGISPQPEAQESADTEGLIETSRIKAALAARLRQSGATPKPAAVETAYHRLMKDREIRRTLETLNRSGSRVAYCSVDVRDAAAFGGLLDSIYRDYGRLDVVIHGAGIMEDKLIRDKTPESFDRVVQTKSDSTFLLSRKLRPESLQCLVLMSSITAAFGNRAQADYAAANGILNGFAGMLAAQWPGRVVAMNWGPWDHSGTVSDEVRQQFLARCVHMIPLAAGAEATLREIEAGPPYDSLIALGEGPWVKSALPAGTPRLQLHAFGSML